ADRNRSHWSTSKTPSYTKSVSWQHHPELHCSRAAFAIMPPPWHAKILLKPAHRFPTNITNQFLAHSR
ncbi:hypothetical protein, partial [Klebsiella quasipneumoniae]|uniref:hypothetical protein n=1 Tax=Klebsiella quasipneumoniae TaxID=1463165 RepID=UPI00283B4214